MLLSRLLISGLGHYSLTRTIPQGLIDIVLISISARLEVGCLALTDMHILSGLDGITKTTQAAAELFRVDLKLDSM